MPIFRVLINGGPMVNIFWVISGAALSLRPLQLARSQSWEKFMLTLFSSVFRRALRLYLPCLAVSIGILTLYCVGAYNHATELNKKWPFAGSNERQAPLLPTIPAQIAHWANDIFMWSNPFDPYRHNYNPHFWTIPQEFKYSILLFATLAGSAKLKPKARVICICLLFCYCMYIDRENFALFLGGMICAEYILSLEDEKEPAFISGNAEIPDTKSWKARIARWTRWVKKLPSWPMWLFLFIFSLHLIGFPRFGSERAYGYAWMSLHTPSFASSKIGFWWTIGSTIIVFPLASAQFLQRIFSNRVSVYLGHISFALYLCHGAINHTLGYRLVPLMWSMIGSDSVWNYELGVILAWMVEAVVVIWLADLVTRYVDQPTVKFGRWVQEKLSV
jgi:peptidoglycan/LPS O-acetylase OafA/YrhL